MKTVGDDSLFGKLYNGLSGTLVSLSGSKSLQMNSNTTASCFIVAARLKQLSACPMSCNFC
jgi:hypothetical protein